MSEEKTAQSVISTGSAEIDNKMGGGIPLGSLVLIEGDSHSGKSVLSQQMIWGSLNDGYTAALFTTENTVKSLVKQMDSLSMNIVDFLLLNYLRVYPVKVARARGNRVLDLLLDAIKAEGDNACDIVFIDALTPAISVSDERDVLGFFEECKDLCSNGLTIVNVVHSHAVSRDFLVRLTALCDSHLKLRTEAVGEKLVKMLEVAKVRGATKNTGNIVSFEVEPGWGMRIIPIAKAKG